MYNHMRNVHSINESIMENETKLNNLIKIAESETPAESMDTEENNNDIKEDIISTRQRKMRINCTLIIKHKWIVKDNVFDMFAQMIFDIKDGNSNSLNLIIIFFMLRWTNILFMKDDNQWHLLVVLKLLRSWL